MGWAIDLDGVVWLAHRAIPGSAAAVERLRRLGCDVLFVTNNSQYERQVVLEHLATVGIEASLDDILTSAMAAASVVDPDERVLCLAGKGVVEALHERGVGVVVDATCPGGTPSAPVDVVVVGRHQELSFDGLTAAVRAVQAGARLVATNDDPAYPTPEGPEPGAGALLAAVEVAGGRAADVIAGKPHGPMAALVSQRLGSGGWVVGDSPLTDGRLAERLGYRFGLVLSGVTAIADPLLAPAPDMVAADLGTLVGRVAAQDRVHPC